MEKEKKIEKALDIPIFTTENKTRLEDFYNKNKKPLSYIGAGIVIVILGFISYTNFIVKPKEKEARDLVFMAQNYFAKDSFSMALNGKQDKFYGFLDVIEEFKHTKTGNLAKYYAGICYLRLGKYEDAIEYLKKFKTNSEILKPMKYGLLGDAYSELKDYETAVKYYIKAAKTKHNKFTTPLFYMKASLVYETLNEYQKALDIYNILKKEFPKSQEASNADKFMGRVTAKMNAK